MVLIARQSEARSTEAGVFPTAVPLQETGKPAIRLRGVGKSFGPTRANEAIDLTITAGEVVGLVGANGAGKSTLMRVICGLVQPDEGSFEIAGEQIDFGAYSPNAALARGIRIVHQELSLCSNLTIAENFMLEEPVPPLAPGARWRSRFRDRARLETEEIFPGVGLRLDANLEELRIGQRQVIEISRAAATENLRLLVLDEPTSSLDAGRSALLREWVRRRAADGVGFIFISHKLHEILDVASRVVVMRNGRIVWDGAAGQTSVAALVEHMGGHPPASVTSPAAAGPRSATIPEAPLVVIRPGVNGLDAELTFGAGEIIGLAGLDGNGQQPFLHALRHAGRRGQMTGGIGCTVEPSFVSGDRRGEGVFPLWSVLENIVVGASVHRNLLGVLSHIQERGAVEPWLHRLRIADSRLNSNILELSGGNQQKVLAARALMRGSRIVLLDDPTRGVDVDTKQEFYRLVREIAAEGALVIWYSTEDAELLECSRVLVFRQGRITRELHGGDITEEAIVACSFIEPGSVSAQTTRAETRRSFARRLVHLAPAGSLIVLLAAMIALNPSSATPFGADLLLSPAVPVILVAVGQMFVIGGSEIDLGIGPFAGLISVLSATLLAGNPSWGFGLILLALAAYSSMGLLIELRRMPSIVVTLGASFVWTGCGYILQATPGGSSPAWLSAIFNWNIPGLPTSAALVVIIAIVAVMIDRTRAGVVLRGFGNDARALRQLGWSAAAYAMLRYAIAGCFAAAAGLSLTAINTASDINAGNAYTLLSIASVVIGGCELLGGSTAPIGVVCGAVTLSLIGALLGFMGISTDYNAAVQGLLLLVILGARGALRQREVRA